MCNLRIKLYSRIVKLGITMQTILLLHPAEIEKRSQNE